MIAAEELAYTAHPEIVRRNEDERRLSGASRRGEESKVLAVVAGAAMAAVGATAALDTMGKAQDASTPIRPVAFETRDAASVRLAPAEAVAHAPVGNLVPPAPHVAPISSPAPLRGDALGVASDMDAIPAQTAPNPNIQFRALTSFDNTMTLTNGGVQYVDQGQQVQQQAAVRRNVQWARPVEWIRTNDLGGAHLAGADPRDAN